MPPFAHLVVALALTFSAVAQTNPEDQAFLTSTSGPTTAGGATAGAQTVTVTATATIIQGASAKPAITAVSDCHPHGTAK